MKKIILFFLLPLYLIMCSCSNSEITNTTQDIKALTIRDDGKIIPLIYYYIEKTKQVYLPGDGHAVDTQRTGLYFAEEKGNGDYTLLKQIKNYTYIYSYVTECIYKNGRYAIKISFDNVVLFDDSFNLTNDIILVTNTIGHIYDLTSDGKRFLNGYNNIWWEYNVDTKINSVIDTNAGPVVAKYSPQDETLIFYIDYSTSTLKSINNDGNNDSVVLSGYNMSRITFNPVGDKIFFVADNKIYSSNLDGTGVAEIVSFSTQWPVGYNIPDYYYELAYNKFVYIENGKIKAINF